MRELSNLKAHIQKTSAVQPVRVSRGNLRCARRLASLRAGRIAKIWLRQQGSSSWGGTAVLCLTLMGAHRPISAEELARRSLASSRGLSSGDDR